MDMLYKIAASALFSMMALITVVSVSLVVIHWDSVSLIVLGN